MPNNLCQGVETLYAEQRYASRTHDHPSVPDLPQMSRRANRPESQQPSNAGKA